MSRFWSSIVSQLQPYVPGEQPLGEMLKLNTNENPYGPSPRALEAIVAGATDRLRLYPDPRSTLLRAAIARRSAVPTDHVFVGNGSDEVLAHVFQGLLKHDRPLLFPDITYSFYPVYCGLYGIEHQTIPLDAGMQIRIEDYDRPSGAVILPNPNAPTGIALPRQAIATLAAAAPDRVLVVDEAYVDFGAESTVPLVATHPNLLVIQTLSKSRALAGLRVGFAIGQPPLIEALERIKDSFNSYPLDQLAMAAATAAIEDEAWFEATCGRIIRTREALAKSLRGRGFEVLPSAANFVFCRLAGRDGADLAAALRERGVLVRHFRQPRIKDHLRITIGSDAQSTQFLSVLDGIIAAPAVRQPVSGG